MSTQTSQSRAFTGWSEVLATLEDTLRHWLTRAVEPAPEPAPQPSAPVPLQLFEERLERLQTYLDRAERNAGQALAPLTAEIEALRQWLNTLKAARGSLVERTARTV